MGYLTEPNIIIFLIFNSLKIKMLPEVGRAAMKCDKVIFSSIILVLCLNVSVAFAASGQPKGEASPLDDFMNFMTKLPSIGAMKEGERQVFLEENTLFIAAIFLGLALLAFCVMRKPKKQSRPRDTLRDLEAGVVWPKAKKSGKKKSGKKKSFMDYCSNGKQNRASIPSDEITASGTKLQHDPYKHWDVEASMNSEMTYVPPGQ